MEGNNLIKKGIVVAVILLFFSVSVIPSTGDIVEDVSVYNRMLDAVDSSEEILSCSHLAYAYVWYDPNGTLNNSLVKFELDDPGNLTCIGEEGGSADYIGSATWTNDGRWIGCGNMGLWDIDPETGNMTHICVGACNFNGIAYGPIDNILYGASSNGGTGGLWIIDMETCELEYVGDFVNTVWMIGIAFDGDGNLYGWDISPDRLYTVDTETGYATVVGSLGINLNYAQDGHFDMVEDILYLSAYTIYPYVGSYLYKCNEDTGNCTLVGQFEGNAALTGMAIPYNLSSLPPVTTISFDPPEPDGCNGWYVSNVTVTLNATDQDGVNATYYRINNGTWETYTEPFIISEDGDDILIEYYSVDIDGNIEDVKSSELDIDQTPPETTLEWDVYKEGCKWYVRFILNATDETSDMAPWVGFYINDMLQGEFEVHWPTFELIIQWSKNFKFCTFKFECLDMAGHSAFELVNGSDIKSRPKSHSIVQQSNYLWSLRFLERFPLLQQLLSFLGRYTW